MFFCFFILQFFTSKIKNLNLALKSFHIFMKYYNFFYYLIFFLADFPHVAEKVEFLIQINLKFKCS